MTRKPSRSWYADPDSVGLYYLDGFQEHESYCGRIELHGRPRQQKGRIE